MKVIYSFEEIKIEGKSIFLAGPTPRNNDVDSWRSEAINILRKNKFMGTVLVPEARKFETKSNYLDEVEWDTKAAEICDLMVFWVPRHIPKLLGLTTNIEFGYYIDKKKIIYGRPNTADDIEYMDWFYEKNIGKKPFDNLENVLKESIKLLEEELK